MEKGSRRAGKSAWEIAESYTQAFQADMRHLNIQEPTSGPARPITSRPDSVHPMH